jgi:hypothetical protein
LVMALGGCGSDGGEEPEGCAARSLDACEEDTSCRLLSLRPWNDASGCWAASEVAACVLAVATCSPVDGCVSDPDGQRWFGGGACAPDGWQAADGDECSGEPRCE